MVIKKNKKKAICYASSSFDYTGDVSMQIVFFIILLFVVIPLALKFPKIIKATFSGIFIFIIYFIKNAPSAINKANN
ncbi:hypothetical protein CBW54_00530 [Yersinia kristensenii]|nr:hypothetical protein CBW54_00530 [Yersinia kristensenii]